MRPVIARLRRVSAGALGIGWLVVAAISFAHASLAVGALFLFVALVHGLWALRFGGKRTR